MRHLLFVRGMARGRSTHQEDDVHAALRLAEKAAEHTKELPISPEATGALAFGGLLALLLVAYAFRSVGTRH